jgi:hypothetical protein
MHRYASGSPAYSQCTTACRLAACDVGNARCSGDLTTATCTSGGCITTVRNGQAYGFNSATSQCDQCTTSQYRNSGGSCQTCPSSCGGQPCQVVDSTITGFTPTQAPGTWATNTALVAVDTNTATSWSETTTGANPWWEAPLGSSRTITSVLITNRPVRLSPSPRSSRSHEHFCFMVHTLHLLFCSHEQRRQMTRALLTPSTVIFALNKKLSHLIYSLFVCLFVYVLTVWCGPTADYNRVSCD